MMTAQKLINSSSSRKGKQRVNRTAVSSFAVALAVAGGANHLLAPTAQAEGFRNPPAGAFNLGRAGGRIAQVDDSSAVAQNPANLVDLQAPEANLAPSFVYFKADYQSPTGQTGETRDPWKVL